MGSALVTGGSRGLGREIAIAFAAAGIDPGLRPENLSPEDYNTHYNLGLLYFDKKNFAKSKEHAKIAYDQGFPLPGLKNKLTKAGQWE